ncbi:MAG TPA: thioredoxin family protein [Chthonomonadaceae bacterium]|nr:thioredoxin family protein [Chthonomonadaceae bacterium]
MGTVTYPNPEVERYIHQYFVPVQFNIVERPEVMDQFNSTWTPTIIVQDADGREHRRAQGYLDPQRFLGELALARVKAAIDRHDYQAAQQRAQEALEMTEGDPVREPEALYWASVADYKASNDVNKLLHGWRELLNEFPESEWAKRAEFIRG